MIKLVFFAWFAFFVCGCKRDYLNGDVEENMPPVLKKIAIQISPNTGGYYEALPYRYHTNSTNLKYPLILSLSGAGAYGNDTSSLTNVLWYGPQNHIDSKIFPGFFYNAGTKYSFIVLAPQFIIPPSPAVLPPALDPIRYILE